MSWSKVSTISLAVLSVIWFALGNDALAIIVGAAFLVGLGEWINRPTADLPRKENWLGILLEVAGVALMLYEIKPGILGGRFSHALMAGTSASMAPGYEDAKKLTETKAAPDYWAKPSSSPHSQNAR